MDYVEATNLLLRRVTSNDIAEELGVSQNAIARARLDPTTRDYRPPPSGWKIAVATLAAKRAAELLDLQQELETEG